MDGNPYTNSNLERHVGERCLGHTGTWLPRFRPYKGVSGGPEKPGCLQMASEGRILTGPRTGESGPTPRYEED